MEFDGQETDDLTTLEKLELVQQVFMEGLTILREVLDAKPNPYMESYIVDHLQILIDPNHPFVTRDQNLMDWIEELRDEIDEDGELD